MLAKQAIEAVQTRLKELGWYVGDVDGDAGPLTELALADFKREAGLNPRAFIGPITLSRLFAPVAPRRSEIPNTLEFPWVLEAQRLKGVKETPGSKDNPVIMNWAKELDIDYDGDDVPWCGLFMAHVMKVGAPSDPLPANPLSARAWLRYGRPVTPQDGAVMVFWRGKRDGWSGHVALYEGEDATHYHVLGGNQSDAVTVTRIVKDRLLGARFPKSFADSGRTTTKAAAGKISDNEA